MTGARRAVGVGAGVFGLTGALELRRRGWEVVLLDPGPLPRPEAASTDASKLVRLDYGSDDLYAALVEKALPGWAEWNERFGDTVYHADGMLYATREPMRPGEYEHDSFATLAARGHRLERLDGRALAARFPAWVAERYADGYYNPRGGWAESGKVVARLAAEARRAGVDLRERSVFARLIEEGSRVAGVVAADGERHRGDVVLVAAGAWTPVLLPWLARSLRVVGQPVLHFRARDPAAFRAPRFVPWAADVARTGWYGFPALPDGTVKVANHGPGRPVHPDAPRTTLPEDEERFRDFLRDTFPALADAPLASSRLCLYCDSPDANFWIDHDPDRDGLVVASGDSGHAFKFAPVLGPIVADVVERRPDRFGGRFAWRTRAGPSADQARRV